MSQENREATPVLPDGTQDPIEDGEYNPDEAAPREFVPVKRTNFNYYTREELNATNPLVAEGYDPMVLMELRSDMYRFLRKLGEVLQNRFDQAPYTVAAAASLCHRFFRRRSMVGNDRYIIAAAAFFTAGKTTYVPRALSDVALASFRVRCEKTPELLQHYEDQRIRRDYEDAVLGAEASLLNANALGFQAVQEVEEMMATLHGVLNEELTALHRGEGAWDDATRQKTIVAFEGLRETAKNLALDIFRADVVLMFPGSQLAIALLRVALRLLKEKKKLPPNYVFEGGAAGAPWYVRRGVEEERMEAMLKEIYAFLNRKAPHPSKVPAVDPVPADILDLQLQQEEEKADMEAKGMLANPYADLAGPPPGQYAPRPPAYPPQGTFQPQPPRGPAPPAAGRIEMTYDDL